MKLSTRCRYGTRAMLEIAKRSGSGPVKRKDIALAQDVTEAYLENILSMLKRHGYLKTVRGADGGFELSKGASQITLFDIVSALEGSIAPVECIENPDSCDKAEKCSSRKVWMKLYVSQRNALENITLEDMVNMEADPKSFAYSI